MPVELRPYQQEAKEEIRSAFTRAKRVIYVLPCAGGKTTIFSSIVAGAAAKGRRVLILAHRSFLFRQICAALNDAGVQHGILTAGTKYTTNQSVVVASVFTLVKRLSHFPAPDLIICDEVHHFAVGNTWSQVFAAFPKAFVLGVTASPVRLSGEGLGDLFQEMVIGPSVAELIALGYLAEPRVYSTPVSPDLRGVHKRGGDYIQPELEAALDKPKLVGDIVGHYRKLAPGKAAVVGAVSIKHAEDIAAAFRDDGWNFATVHGKLDEFEQKKLFDALARRELHGLTFCNLISEGYDLPLLEVYIGARPTMSLQIMIQHWGRVMRTAPGKQHGLILDHAGNVSLHGLPDEDRVWTLEKSVDRKTRSQVPTVRTCHKCFAMHRPQPKCPVCGHEYEVSGRMVDHVDGELEQVSGGTEADYLVDLERRFHILRKVGERRKLVDPSQWALSVVAAELARRRAPKEGEPSVNGVSVGDYDELKGRVERAMTLERERNEAQMKMEV